MVGGRGGPSVGEFPAWIPPRGGGAAGGGAGGGAGEATGSLFPGGTYLGSPKRNPTARPVARHARAPRRGVPTACQDAYSRYGKRMTRNPRTMPTNIAMDIEPNSGICV